MDLGVLVTNVERNVYKPRFKASLDSLETGKGIFSNDPNLYGQDTAYFYVSLINQYDKSMVENNLHVLSIEQQDLLQWYFKEANTLTRQHTSAEKQDYTEEELSKEEYRKRYKNLSRTIQKLDEFLGSYVGVEDGQFSRISKKQLYSKRKFAGQKTPVLIRDK
jgi:hypothetical protein